MSNVNNNFQKQKAMYEKEQGNSAFKAGKYKEAVSLYTKGIELDKSQPVLFCNRAMAFLKLNRCFDAKVDCDAALRLDPTYVKAYYRRGLAYSSFNDVDNALGDFERVLVFEPQNKEAQKEIDKLMRLLSENPDKLRQVRPVNKAKSLPLQSLKRVDVKEVDSLNGAEVVASERPSPPPPSCVIKKKEKDDVDRIFLEEQQALSANITSMSISAPKTAFQFLSGWRSLKHDGRKFCTYLLQIPVASYENVIDNCLEPPLVTDILTVFSEYGESHPEKSLIYACLKKLTVLNHFKRCKLFFDEKDMKKLDVVCEYLKTESTINEKDLIELKSLFSN